MPDELLTKLGFPAFREVSGQTSVSRLIPAGQRWVVPQDSVE